MTSMVTYLGRVLVLLTADNNSGASNYAQGNNNTNTATADHNSNAFQGIGAFNDVSGKRQQHHRLR